MNSQKTTLLLWGVLLMVLPEAWGQEWRKIVPLTSTRADVERLLGPNDQVSLVVDYQVINGSLSVRYSSGPCSKERKGGWDVAEGVVTGLTFWSNHKQKEKELKLDRKKFRRVVDSHTGRNIYYINDEDGIMYEVQGGLVEYAEYFPPKRYEHLRCGDADGNDK